MLTDGNFDQASARIRAIQYIPLFENEGFSVTFIPRIPLKTDNTFLKYTYFPLVKRLLRINTYYALYFRRWDIVFIQRLFLNKHALKRISNRSRVIFDFDDAIYIDKHNISAWDRAHKMVKYAHEVIVSTPWLNDFCQKCGKNATVIPTPVETDVIKPIVKTNIGIPVIGWIGSAWTTDYLKAIEPVLQQLNKNINFEFLTVGAKTGYIIDGVKHQNLTWEPGIEAKALSKIDIGIMPIPDEDYARAKGGYKLYLYMAAGLPCVASPVGVNNTIINSGRNGILATSLTEWYEALNLLLNNNELRKNMGLAGRKQATELYDRKVCFSQLIRKIKNTDADEYYQ